MTGIERLRQFAKGCRLVGQKAYSNAIGDIADQIEREHNVSDREEHDAAVWVRDHGGLERVKWLLDWCLSHDSKIEQLDFDFWLSGRVMHELGFEGDMADRDEVERRLAARLVPEGDDPDEPEDIVWCGEHAANGFKVWRIADQLTHTKPEPPDSLERIADEIDRLREEVALHLGDYLYDEDGNGSIQFSMELVAKRCRALAERERGE